MPGITLHPLTQNVVTDRGKSKPVSPKPVDQDPSTSNPELDSLQLSGIEASCTLGGRSGASVHPLCLPGFCRVWGLRMRFFGFGGSCPVVGDSCSQGLGSWIWVLGIRIYTLWSAVRYFALALLYVPTVLG